MNKSSNYASQYRQRLIDSQVIIEAGYGKVSFSLPFMKEFLLKDADYPLIIDFMEDPSTPIGRIEYDY